MTDDEKLLLHALAWMCEQYLGSGKADYLDDEAMGAGEDAIALLAKYGLVEPVPRGGAWTEKGKNFLGSEIRSA